MTTMVWLDSPGAIEQHLLRDIPVHDLAEPGVRFIMCDRDNQVVLHAHIGAGDDGDGMGGGTGGHNARSDAGELPDDGLGDGPDATVIRWIRLLGESGALDGLLIALTRPGRATLTATDRACFHAARTACAEHGVRLLGVHVVTPGGQRAVVLDDVL